LAVTAVKLFAGADRFRLAPAGRNLNAIGRPVASSGATASTSWRHTTSPIPLV
jgi:hypothetical protein